MEQINRNSFTVEYTVEDLRRMITRPERYVPVNFYQDTPIHLVMTPEELPGEVFKKGLVSVGQNANKVVFEIEGSNFGRVRSHGKILEQNDPKNADYLMVTIEDEDTSAPVHRVIATLWCKSPEGIDVSTLQVHHITNNGFDNRPCNLLWVSQIEHSKIEAGLFKSTN